MIELSKIECTGCSACVSVCGTGAIKMGKDEAGFPIPVVVAKNNCVGCGLCEKVCPCLNAQDEHANTDEIAIISQITDEAIRKESTSGGMFSAIALTVLKHGGIVYGAAYSDSFLVHHVGIENPDQLWRLRNSKYIQSDLGNTFNEVREQLLKGRQVCFSGTPCQVEGLASFLQKPYENLVLVDITCHGIGSPLVWDKYLELAKGYGPEKIFFRWKHYGYKYSTMSFFDADNREVYFGDVETDSMLKAYFTNSCDRDSCYNCRFKKRYRVSDFTIWDCFQPQIFDASFDDDRGTSSVLVNTIKGRKLLQEMIYDGRIRFCRVEPSDLVVGNRELIQSIKKSSCRDAFMEDAKVLEASKLFQKYFPNDTKARIREYMRCVLLKTGMYSIVKSCLYRYRRKRMYR